MLKSARKLIVLIAAACLPFAVIMTRAQQIQCADVIKRILQETGDRCKDVGRNKGCYGNSLILATPADGVSRSGDNAFKFDAPGDLANLSDLASLRLAAFKEGSEEWGVAYLRVQANFPDSAPGQYVTMLLFGDSNLEDKSKQAANKGGTPQKSMQAVYFRTGGGALACKGAPTNGLIIQTPKGATKAELTVNEVKLSVGSTVFIESPDDDLPPLTLRPAASNTPVASPTISSTRKNKLIVTTIEGEAKITAFGVTRTIAAGQKSQVALVPDNSRPVAAPSVPVSAAVDIASLLGLVVQDSVTNTLLEPTATITPSVTPGGPTLTRTPTIVPRRVFTFTPPPTLVPATQTPIGIGTQFIPTVTPFPSITLIPLTNTPLPTSTPVPPPTNTPIPSNTPVPTLMPVPSNTLTNRPTNTPTP